MLSGISLRASRRTMSGTRILPMPWPVKSTLMVSRERESVTGSTRTSTAARIGPSVPRTPQARGGSICTSSEVEGRLAPPIRRVVTHLAPTAGVPPSGPSMCPSTTPFCHSRNRAGSVAQAKTSAAGRPIWALVTMGGMSAALLHEGGVAVQVQRPALLPVHAVGDGFPAGAVPVDVPVLQLDPGAVRGLGVEPHLDLAGLGRVGLDGPAGADVPAEHHPVRRVEGQDPRPPALAAVRRPVRDAAADPGLEHRLGDRRAEQVMLRRLEVPEPVGEHSESTLYRRVHHDLLADRHCLGLGHYPSSSGACAVSAYPASARCQYVSS